MWNGNVQNVTFPSTWFGMELRIKKISYSHCIWQRQRSGETAFPVTTLNDGELSCLFAELNRGSFHKALTLTVKMPGNPKAIRNFNKRRSIEPVEVEFGAQVDENNIYLFNKWSKRFTFASHQSICIDINSQLWRSPSWSQTQ